MMQIGQTILGKYTIDDLISEGGQVSVAKGVDNDSGEVVAVRELTATPGQPNYDQLVERFIREGDLRIGHPNVIDPVDCSEEGGEWYMIMRYIDGPTLEQYVARQGGKLSADETVDVICQVASGLGACHAKGVVHRDIKPANILIDSGGRAYLIDFGISALTHLQTLTQGTGFQGSLQWASPEQVIDPGCRDHRLDLYSLGATSYYTLTGSVPVRGETAEEIMLCIYQWTPPPPRQLDPSIPPNIDQACMRLLQKRPEDRFQTADQFVKALNGHVGVGGQCLFCPSCGVSGDARMRFCPHCGACMSAASMSQVHCLACGAPSPDAFQCSSCSRPFGSVAHRLTFDVGPLSGMVFRIPEGIYMIGRDALAPRDYSISRQHLQVACLNGTVHVVDAGSTNKTCVAGRFADQPVLLTSNVELSIAGNMGTYTSNS